MRVISFLVLSALMVAKAVAQDTGQMSLKECVDYALKSNEQLKIANYEQDIAKAKVGEIRSQGLPQVDINGGLNYNFEPQKSLLNPSTFGDAGNGGGSPSGNEGLIDGDLPISFQQKYDGNAGLGVSQLIFDGSYFVGLQAARTFRELSGKQKRKTEIEVVEAVAKAYYLVLINQERLLLVNVNFQRVDSLLRDTELMYKNGFAEKIDVSRIKVSRNNLAVQKQQLENLSNVSLDLLKFQMGMPLEQELVLTDTLEDLPLEEELSAKMDEFDYKTRIEYAQLLTNESLATLDLKNNKSQYLPKIYASFNYGYNTAAPRSGKLFNPMERWLNYGSLGATISLPIFDGLRKSYKIQQNRLQLKQIENQRQLLEKNIDIEISTVRNNLETAVQAVTVQEENKTLAEEVYNISKVKYQEGVGSNLEVIEADAALKEAQTNYYNSLYDAIIAKIELQKALGILYQ